MERTAFADLALIQKSAPFLGSRLDRPREIWVQHHLTASYPKPQVRRTPRPHSSGDSFRINIAS